MTVTVTPEKFTMVAYDAGEIAAIVQKLLDQIGMGDVDVQIKVDETSPLGRSQVVSLDPVVIETESGAIEDPKRPRQLSSVGAADVFGRALMRVADRRTGGFADAPSDGDLTLPLSVAWAVYSNGRLERLGYHPQRQRWLYHFRNRHGFTDTADAAFDKLWNGTSLTWDDIVGLSEGATARESVA
jgi:hypothetical protein